MKKHCSVSCFSNETLYRKLYVIKYSQHSVFILKLIDPFLFSSNPSNQTLKINAWLGFLGVTIQETGGLWRGSHGLQAWPPRALAWVLLLIVHLSLALVLLAYAAWRYPCGFTINIHVPFAFFQKPWGKIGVADLKTAC